MLVDVVEQMCLYLVLIVLNVVVIVHVYELIFQFRHLIPHEVVEFHFEVVLYVRVILDFHLLIVLFELQVDQV